MSVLVTAGTHLQKGLQQSLLPKAWPEAHQNQSDNAVTSRESCVQQMAANSQLWVFETGSSALENKGQSIH